jgi:N-acetylneuraminic acid mutarotase
MKNNHIIKSIIWLIIQVGSVLFRQSQAQDVPSWWEELTPMSVAKGYSGSAVIDGRIYIVGGWNNMNSTAIASTEVYNPETDSWSSKANMHFLRGALTVEAVNNKLYAIGGATHWNTTTVCDFVEQYDPEKNSWTTKTAMPGKRGWHFSCVCNNKIYVFGGLKGLYDAGWEISNLVYDPETDEWDSIAPLNYRRQSASCCVFDNKIYVFGGWNGALSWETRAEIYDPLTDTWSSNNYIPGNLASQHTFLYNNIMYNIAGGWSDDDLQSQPVWQYDPADSSWQEMEKIPVSFYWSTQQKIGDYVYIFGGFNDLNLDYINWTILSEAYRINLPLVSPKSEITESLDLNSSNSEPFIQIYPNPFNSKTVISYQLPEISNIEVGIYDLTGGEITTLLKEQQKPGIHKVEWNIKGVIPGIYFLRLQAGSYVQTKKMIVLE